MNSIKTWLRRVALGLGIALLVPATTSAQEVPADKQAEFLLRAFEYDRNLKSRVGGTLRIVLLYSDDAAAVEPVRAAFEAAGVGGVQGVQVSVVAVKFEAVGALLKLVDAEGVGAIYISEGLRGALSSIQQVTRGRKIPSMAASRSMVDQGVSLAVYDEGGQPKLAVNLRSSKVEGLQLAAEILGISKVIR